MNMNNAGGALPTLRCPKCAAEMATYERSGIVVDQCRECRGIFLDRGELERLVDAESGGAGWAGPQMRAPAPVPLPYAREPRSVPGDARSYPAERRDDDDDDDDRRYRLGGWEDRGRWEGDGKPRKRRGILGELLDSLGD